MWVEINIIPQKTPAVLAVLPVHEFLLFVCFYISKACLFHLMIYEAVQLGQTLLSASLSPSNAVAPDFHLTTSPSPPTTPSHSFHENTGFQHLGVLWHQTAIAAVPSKPVNTHSLIQHQNFRFRRMGQAHIFASPTNDPRITSEKLLICTTTESYWAECVNIWWFVNLRCMGVTHKHLP